MKESTQQLMLNAEETLRAAEVLFKEEYLRDAVNRAYYSVFYIAEASPRSSLSPANYLSGSPSAWGANSRRMGESSNAKTGSAPQRRSRSG